MTISYPHDVGGGNDRVHFAAVIALAAKCEDWRGCHFVAGYNETLKQHGLTWIGHVGNRVRDQVAGLLGDQVFTTPGEHIDAYRRRELAASINQGAGAPGLDPAMTRRFDPSVQAVSK